MNIQLVNNPKTILIAGATASGKSALALRIAQAFGGTVINADSMQVYRDLRVITARPTDAETAQIPHLLYGHVDAAENYSVGRWCRDAALAITKVERAGRLPILVGGTGLYFTALTRGLASVPPIPADIRSAVRGRLTSEGVAALHADLTRRDPATAGRLMVGDRARVTRALEVVLATGRSLTDWHRDGMPAAIDAACAVRIFLNVERADLYRRINERFDVMLSSGALDEVRALAARHLDPMLPAMKAHGVPWLIRHLRGEISLEEAAEGGKRDTRRYTKRQGTWFRNQLPDWTWVAAEEAQKLIREFLNQPFRLPPP